VSSRGGRERKTHCILEIKVEKEVEKVKERGRERVRVRRPGKVDRGHVGDRNSHPSHIWSSTSSLILHEK